MGVSEEVYTIIMKETQTLILIVVGMVILGVVLLWGTPSEKYNRFGGPPYVNMCEFQPACLWDTARWVQLSNGMEGVCTLHGLACPAFSKDHDSARNAGLSPTMVSNRYMNRIREARADASASSASTSSAEGYSSPESIYQGGKYTSPGQYNEATPENTALDMLV